MMLTAHSVHSRKTVWAERVTNLLVSEVALLDIKVTNVPPMEFNVP